jgi:hypothetical protein
LPNNVVLRLFIVGREVTAGNYHRYYSGFRSAIKDLLSRIKSSAFRGNWFQAKLETLIVFVTLDE